jgi:TonB family protein
MKRRTRLLVVAGLMILASLYAFAGNVKVIANSSVKVDTITVDELKMIFLQEKLALGDGTHVEPVFEKRGGAHEAFLKEYLNRNDDDLQTYYRTLVFTGRGAMPKQLASDTEVVTYVAKTRGAIGYVSASTAVEGVKVLAVVSAGSGAQRTLLTRVEPEYPDTLQRLHIGGTVRLAVTISAKGSVESIELLGGNPILGASAINAVNKWVYAAGHSRTVTEIIISF